ncbi:MAG: DUF3093 domain-containing protein [Microbacteriaceae bacterium]|nr:DUF3093 domain-containing protein [Microbacteriaceae bacterium]
MQFYRERLWPSPWAFVSTSLVIPASLLVFLPINFTVGVITAIILYGGCIVLLLSTSPRVSVTASHLVAGRARLPVALTGPAESFNGEDARIQRGQQLDSRAWLVIRGWIDPVVKIPNLDAADPAPYWLVSSRRPKALAAAVAEARTAGERPEVIEKT